MSSAAQRMRSIFLSAVFALLIAIGGGHPAHAATAYDNPSTPTVVMQSSPVTAREVPARPSILKDSRVFDQAGLLDTRCLQALNSQIRSAEASTRSEILLVTLKSIGQRNQKDYATEMFNRWQVGRSDEKRGVLVLFVADGGANGRGRIEVSVWKGFNSQVSHSWTSSMLEASVLPSLRVREFETGFARCVARLEPRLTMSASDVATSGLVNLLALPAGVGGILALANVMGRRSRTCDKCGAVCEPKRCDPWEVVTAATDFSDGLRQRKIRCHKCGATSIKSDKIRKYDGKRMNSDGSYSYYYDSSSDGGGSDGGGGGGGDC